jgi:hypothetical protein
VEKDIEKYMKIKNRFISVQSKLAYFTTFVASFKKFFETVSKGLQRKSVQFGRFS